MRLKDKIAIVTGAAGGQGKATAELFAREGATVYAADLAPGPYEAPGVHQVVLDVGDREGWDALVAKIVAKHGRVDILVNNAGIAGSSGAFHTTTMEDWNKVLRVNLTGPFLGMLAVIPEMRKAGKGSIINIISNTAKMAVPFVAPYHASKGGLDCLTKTVALQYADEGIRVNAVYPGIIATPMMEETTRNEKHMAAFRSGTPMGRVGEPIEVANASLFLASDEASFVTGAEIVVDGGAIIQSAIAAQQGAAVAS